MLKAVMLKTSLIAAAVSLSISAHAMADSPKPVNVPAGDLIGALELLQKQSHVEIVYRPELLKDLRTPGVKGTLSSEAAVTRLLEGTKLQIHSDKAGVLLITDVKRLRTSALGATSGSSASMQPQSQDVPSDSEGSSTAAAADDSGASGAQIDEIVVTGTRLVSNGNNQPTPVTVVTANDLLAGTPNSVAGALVELPGFKDSASPSTGGAAARAGHTYLNLRSLGEARNLVLLDGRRFVPTTDGGAPDINLFPQLLLKRVEVVTGGASAAYGSDAVAGVTNFILDNDFTGVKTLLSGGTSTYGDNDILRFSIAGGEKFLDGRLRVVASLDATNTTGAIGSGIGGPNRPWSTAARFLINNPNVTPTNPASPTNPTLIVAENVRSPLSAFGGMIPSGPLKGIAFGPGGVPQTFHYGTQLTTAAMSGGDGTNTASTATIISPMHMRVFFTHAAFDFTDDVTGYFEGNYAKTRTHLIAGHASNAADRNPFQIQIDNAFLPASIRQQMIDKNVRSFPLGREILDFGYFDKTVDTATTRGVLGLKGTFATDWTWDVNYQHGQNRGTFAGVNGVNVLNMFNAADAVVDPANGAVVCRTTLTYRNNGCVPVNLFGVGSPSAAALAYIHAEPQAIEVVKEDVVAASIQGSPFSNWAGEVQTAAGYEFRRESVKQTVSPLTQVIITNPEGIRGFPASYMNTQGVYAIGTSNPVNGHYFDNEVFGEANVPLVKDAFLAKTLDLNAAYRFTDYSTVGKVNTWKVGLVYSPVEDLRLRGTYSRDVRAPNIGELFLPQALTGNTVRDPTRGDEAIRANIRSPGNPNLKAERASTTTYGFVYQPHWLPNFSTALDVYSISIDDAISRLGSQTTVTQCFQGNQALCDQIVRTGGLITEITLPTLNLSQLTQRGMDLELNYRMNLEDLSHWTNGSLRLRALATYVHKDTRTTPGSPTIDYADEDPVLVNLVADYNLGNFGVFVQGRYIGKHKIDVTYTPSMIANNWYRPYWYADLTLDYKPTFNWATDFEVFGTVNNLFNKEPPTGVTTNSGTGTVTDSANYDVVGRAYTVGARIRF